MKTARNVAIVLALAAAVVFVPGGGNGSAVVGQALSIAVFASIAWYAGRMYREHRVAIYSLGDQTRAILYASLGIVTLTLTATSRLWSTGAGTVAWFVLIGLASAGVMHVLRVSREHW